MKEPYWKQYAKERQVNIYPNPYIHKLLRGFAFVNGKSKSKAVSEIMEKHFNSLSDEDKKKYLEFGE